MKSKARVVCSFCGKQIKKKTTYNINILGGVTCEECLKKKDESEKEP